MEETALIRIFLVIGNISNNPIASVKKPGKRSRKAPITRAAPETISNKGSAIFLHLTKNYYPTAGCVALKKKDFLILLKLIDSKTKIKIH